MRAKELGQMLKIILKNLLKWELSQTTALLNIWIPQKFGKRMWIGCISKWVKSSSNELQFSSRVHENVKLSFQVLFKVFIFSMASMFLLGQSVYFIWDHQYSTRWYHAGANHGIEMVGPGRWRKKMDGAIEVACTGWPGHRQDLQQRWNFGECEVLNIQIEMWQPCLEGRMRSQAVHCQMSFIILLAHACMYVYTVFLSDVYYCLYCNFYALCYWIYWIVIDFRYFFELRHKFVSEL